MGKTGLGQLGMPVGMCVVREEAKENMFMNQINRLMLVGATAAWAVTFTGAQAQETPGRVRVGDTELKGSVQTDQTRTADRNLTIAADRQSMVSKANKASGLIGMDVRNSQNEKLGEIKDLV